MAERTGTPKVETPTVDLSGVWETNMQRFPWADYSFTPDIPPMTPWGKARYLAAKPSYGRRATDPSTDYVNPTTGKDPGCLPPGVPRIYIQPFLFEIVQIPGRVLELFEFDHHIRQIFTDGRQHPKDPDPTWMGDSVGHYEGDTLVVDTVGLNDKTWIDRGGLPHSDQLHLIERIRRPSPDALEIKFTIDDPKTYTETWQGYRNFKLRPTWNIKEFICADNADYNEEFINKGGAYTSPKQSTKQPKPAAPKK
ncbi:MAG TPA: hypothetical protein VGT24_07490 [Candidatus Acidoferrales bacterium]|nr:hypothetical protein [Candidatus Acidoferrales bacterium]